MASDGQRRNIVIVGGGIIGCTTAYFLTRHPSYNPSLHTIIILEATGIASGASGKAGGLLALWAYPSCIVPLSYRLHAELAAEHNGAERWGYRMLHCGALSSKGRVLSASSPDGALKGDTKGEWTKLPKVEAGRDPQRKRATGVPDDLDWFVQENITSYNSMGDPTTTAQVHPYEFTTSMASLAQDKGVEVVLGKVTSISSSSEKVETVTYQDKRTSQTHTIPATDVIVSAGPWTSHILRDAPISAMRAHSVTIRATVSPYAIFSEISLPRDFTAGSGSGATRSSSQHPKFVSPEMYARPNNEVYACGEGDTLVPLPASSDLVETSERACQDIIDYVGSISDELRGGEVLVRQACYLPAVEGANGPLIGKTKIEGLFLAAGHTCWGIQNSAATGLLMSEFVWEGKARSAAVGSLDPRSAF